MYLPDVNFWLALAFEKHVHHRSAKQWFESVPDESAAFCRLTQLGFLRLATNPQALGADAVNLADAWKLYDALRADPRVTFADEPANLESSWRELAQHQSFSPKVWNDAYLAAFAKVSGRHVATFDQGFKAYSDVIVVILS